VPGGVTYTFIGTDIPTQVFILAESIVKTGLGKMDIVTLLDCGVQPNTGSAVAVSTYVVVTVDEPNVISIVSLLTNDVGVHV
jgi:hypothetical protein